MTYVSWAAMHEGISDESYFDVLLPRIMEAIILGEGRGHSDIPTLPAMPFGRSGRSVYEVAQEICAGKEAIHIIFIHADTGGKALEADIGRRSTSYCEALAEVCDWPSKRCVTVLPRHETEAWILADPAAVLDALGYKGSAKSVGLPEDAAHAERLVDPKATLAAVLNEVAGPRRRSSRIEQLFAAIAQRQSIEMLRRSRSYCDFEARLRLALRDLGCID